MRKDPKQPDEESEDASPLQSGSPPAKAGPTERELLADLFSDLKAVPATGVVLLVVAVVGGAALFEAFPVESSIQKSVAAAAGLVGTLLAVAVALAIFRWTQGDSEQTRERDRALKASVEDLEVKLGPADRAAEDALQAAGNESEDDDSEPVAPTSSRTIVLHGRRYQISAAQANSAGWWADLLGRVRAVAGSGGEHSEAAHALLSVPLAAFELTATLETESRGNRRTLIITAADAQERVWSVFSGKGKHVIDVTRQVE